MRHHAAVSRSCGMLDVQQFVVKDKVQHDVWCSRRVEKEADDDHVVGGIIAAQEPPRSCCGPRQSWSFKLSLEVGRIQPFKVCFQILPPALGNSRSRPTPSCAAGMSRTLLHGAFKDETPGGLGGERGHLA